MDSVIEGVINKGAGRVLFGGKSLRGQLRTADFLYEVMIGVALEMTDRLPMFFEDCRQDYEKRKKWNEKFTTRGKYTDSYGWSPDYEFKHEMDIHPTFFNYFNRIIVPFLGGRMKSWNDESSRIWKHIKRVIISGDKEKITKLQGNIRRRIMKESQKRIQVPMGGAILGPNS